MKGREDVNITMSLLNVTWFSSFRQAYGNALLKLCENHPRVVALDGDMKNSTFSQGVRKKFSERHVECFICEQNMAGVSGKAPTCLQFCTQDFAQKSCVALFEANLLMRCK